MSLRRSDDAKWCASVDHVVPRALGGTHEPSNLQLAHLYCNQVKSDLRGAIT
ncbi:HNH endonuclease signature motif containing protein [Streptomyces sp. JL1001]|uniref:HNH endonuclease signature motif containing protein n=1 Tax=Streptomyces sp. JL1001 TaxID=3078227 RepID=A0AAU8K7J8_9ACTN